MSTSKKKDKKRRYTYTNLNDFKIENDFQTETYRNFIINFLMTRGNLKKSEAEKYTEDMNLYIQAVTHDSVTPTDLTFNYEMLEHLGDETVNKCATWYLKNRFPQIMRRGDKGVSLFSSQRAILKAKPKLAEFCQRIGLAQFIRYRKLEYEFYKEGSSLQNTGKFIEQKNIKSIVMDNSMKEDAFEAFFAAIEMSIDNSEGMIGIGYSVVFKILSSIFDEETISIYLYDLIDYKTQLKEIFDKRRNTYKDQETYQKLKTDEVTNISLEISIHTGPILQGDLASGEIKQANIPKDIKMRFGPINTRVSKDNEEEYDSTTKQVEQQLAKQALEWIGQNLGIYRYKPNVDYSATSSTTWLLQGLSSEDYSKILEKISSYGKFKLNEGDSWRKDIDLSQEFFCDQQIFDYLLKLKPKGDKKIIAYGSEHPFLNKILQVVKMHSGKDYKQMTINYYKDETENILTSSDDKPVVESSDIYMFNFGSIYQLDILSKSKKAIFGTTLYHNQLTILGGEIQKYYNFKLSKRYDFVDDRYDMTKPNSPYINIILQLYK